MRKRGARNHVAVASLAGPRTICKVTARDTPVAIPPPALCVFGVFGWAQPNTSNTRQVVGHTLASQRNRRAPGIA